jgi:hypothetical protein
MRKRPAAASAAIAVMMICISILASCATGGPAFTDAEVDYTIHYVLEKAEEQAVSDLFMKLNRFTEPMVPDEYYIMVRMRDTIPGMNGILNNWARQTSAYVLGFYDSFREYSRNLAQSQTFTDPRALLGSGSSAASLYLKRLHYNEVRQIIRDNLTEPDPTYWNEAVLQYNAWINTGSLLNGQTPRTISAPSDTDAVADMLADYLADLYFRTLASTETLIRTTPDPQMDSLAAQVLGLI